MASQASNRSTVNKLKHLANEALRLSERFDELCPAHYANDFVKVADDDSTGKAWRYAHNAIFNAFESIDEVVFLLTPWTPDEAGDDDECL